MTHTHQYYKMYVPCIKRHTVCVHTDLIYDPFIYGLMCFNAVSLYNLVFVTSPPTLLATL